MVCAASSNKPDRRLLRPWAGLARLALLSLCAINALSPAHAAELIIDPGPTIELAGLQDQFQQLAVKVSPSVVAISAGITDHSGKLLYADDLTGEKIDKAMDAETHVVGTGAIIDANGLILTNEHVVSQASCLWVTFDDGKTLPAMVVASDPRQDIAILKTPATGLTPVTFNPDPVHRGQWAFALGNPFGLATRGNLSLSVGVVSATGRSLSKLSNREDRLYCNLIQTTAEINPGNSGGPLFDISGNVIGIATAVIMPQKATNGIGFAMPITPQLQQDIQTLSSGNEVVYGFLGVRVSSASAQQRRAAGMPAEGGVVIDAIEDQTPAQKSGLLKPGDLISSVVGQPVTDGDSFVAMVGRLPAGKPALFNVYRGGAMLKLMLTPEARPLSTVAVTRQRQRFFWQGMQLGPMPANWPGAKNPSAINASAISKTPGESSPGDSLPGSQTSGEDNTAGSTPSPSITSGVMVVAIDEDSPMRSRGAKAGSILLTISGKPITAIDQLMDLLANTPTDQCTPAFDTPTVTSAVMMSHE